MDKKYKNLEDGRVILSYGRSLMALVAAHSLGKKGVEVIGADSVDFTVLSFSRYVKDMFLYTDPEKDEERYLTDLEEHIKRFKPADGRPYVLMPMFRDAKLIARHKERFAPLIDLAVPSYEAIDKIHPKDHFSRTVEELNVAAPETWLPEDEGALNDVAGEVQYPVLIKPRDETGGRGIHKVKNAQELKALWREVKEEFQSLPLVQETVEGKDYCLTALFENGEMKVSMAYRNLHRFPLESGAGALRETVEDEHFKQIAIKLMKPLKWNGVAEFDFLWDEKENSTPQLIEVNPRFWGGLFQSVESGIDFPWLLYELAATGHVSESVDAKLGTRTKLPVIWLYSAVQDIVRSDEEYQKIEKQGHKALQHLKEGHLYDGFTLYTEYVLRSIGDTFNVPKKIKALKGALDLGKTARSELFSEEDPYAALGILFILGSLIRHGHLPHEVKL